MGLHYKKNNIHWNYYLSIEKDFELMSRYIEFCKGNDKTFSIELAKLIMASTQEVDVVMKKLCALVDPTSEPSNILQYQSIINAHLPKFKNEKVFMPRFGISSRPWLNWRTNEKPPSWWTANNKIKHQRTDYFERANLKNAHNAIGGLLITIMYYYKKERELQEGKSIEWQEITHVLRPKSSLFKLKDDYYYGETRVGKPEW